MQSERLTYAALAARDVDEFHSLIQDDHVRRYLLDGESFTRAWSMERIGDSQRSFERRGVGLWLARDKTTGVLVGFCGFLQIAAPPADPELVYAMPEACAGKGYATEMARAAITEARKHPGFSTITAAVDEVNVASVRVLDKLGFQRTGTRPGSFGAMLLFRLG